MLRLLRAELYRSFRDRVLLILLVFTIILFFFFWNGMNIRSVSAMEKQFETLGFRATTQSAGWDGETEHTPENEVAFFDYYVELSYARMLREVVPVLFFSVYAAAYLIGTKFTRRTINAALCRGYSRAQTFGAAFAHYVLLVVVTLALTVLIYLFAKFGAKCLPLLQTVHFWRNLGLWLYLAIGAMMLPFAAAFVIRNLFGSLLAGFVQMLVVALLPRAGFRGAILSGGVMDFRPLGIMEKEALWMPGVTLTTQQQSLLFLIPAAIFIACVLGAAAVFWKCTVK